VSKRDRLGKRITGVEKKTMTGRAGKAVGLFCTGGKRQCRGKKNQKIVERQKKGGNPFFGELKKLLGSRLTLEKTKLERKSPGETPKGVGWGEHLDRARCQDKKKITVVETGMGAWPRRKNRGGGGF